ncbi:MAG: hypothetical protein H0V07_00025, partial [Propionibacteriales bacterium]|nr:hypothetical protein [Propionibacteriales bacterium]
MSSIATTKTAGADTGLLAFVRSHAKLLTLLGVIAVWVVIWAMTRGHDTLEISGAQVTDAHRWFADRATSIEDAASAGTNPVFVVTNTIADGINWLIN